MDVDRRSDIYAFGVVCYEILSGRPPFKAKSVYELATLVLSHDPASHPHEREVAACLRGGERCWSRAAPRSLELRLLLSLRFLLPWARRAKGQWFRATFELEFPAAQTTSSRPSIIAHSFGTGSEDIWTELVDQFIQGTGRSGVDGFSTTHPRLEQERFTFAHSEYFERGHRRTSGFHS